MQAFCIIFPINPIFPLKIPAFRFQYSILSLLYSLNGTILDVQFNPPANFANFLTIKNRRITNAFFTRSDTTVFFCYIKIFKERFMCSVLFCSRLCFSSISCKQFCFTVFMLAQLFGFFKWGKRLF